jgi:hypothetical protein
MGVINKLSGSYTIGISAFSQNQNTNYDTV